MQSKLLIIFTFYLIFSCRSYQNKLEITQLKTEEPRTVRYSGEATYAVARLPIKFKVTNNTINDRLFWNFNLNYKNLNGGVPGTLYLNDGNKMINLNLDSKFDLNKGSS